MTGKLEASPQSGRTLWDAKAAGGERTSRIASSVDLSAIARAQRETSDRSVANLTEPFRTPVTDETLSRWTD